MKSTRFPTRFALIALAFLIAVAACAPATSGPTDEQENPLDMANPASVYCEGQGGRLEMRTDENGTVGVCIFTDGSECEEWAFYRGECSPSGHAVDEILVPDPEAARDAALSYLRTTGDQVPSIRASWQSEDIMQEGVVGAGRFRFTTEHWTVEVSFPIVAPQATIYNVAITDSLTGYAWQGQVDASGRVSDGPQEAGQPDVGMANPAAVYCQEQGFLLESRTSEAGTAGVCILNDGTECDEWAYWRGECGPASSQQRVNVALDANLFQATALEILELDPAAESSQPYRTLLRIDDEYQLADLARTLNISAPRTPKTFCVPTTLLRFQFADGTEQEIGFMCDAAEPTLSGEGSFWGNQEAAAPVQFQALLASHLGRSQVPPPGDALNVIAAAELADTERIEVLLQTHSQVEDIAQATIQPIANITDPATIQVIVDSLNAELALGPRARCLAEAVLTFHRPGGSTYSMSYGCSLEEAVFLRGDDPFWGGRDLLAPPGFLELIQGAIQMSPLEPISDDTLRAVAWYGRVTTDDSGDLLVLYPKGAGELALIGDEDEHQQQIAELRDKTEPGRNAHFWGAVECDQEGCTLVADRIRVDGPGPLYPPETVDAWQGTLIVMSTEPGSGPDDAFVLSGDWPLHYGVWSEDPELAGQLESLRNTGRTFRIWGQLVAGIPDANATQIVVTTIELLD